MRRREPRTTYCELRPTGRLVPASAGPTVPRTKQQRSSPLPQALRKEISQLARKLQHDYRVLFASNEQNIRRGFGPLLLAGVELFVSRSGCYNFRT
jgi:uncharacterized protein YfaQ (DUF2300 family)